MFSEKLVLLHLKNNVIQKVQLKFEALRFFAFWPLIILTLISLISQSSFLKPKTLYYFRNMFTTEYKVNWTDTLLSTAGYDIVMNGLYLSTEEEYREKKC